MTAGTRECRALVSSYQPNPRLVHWLRCSERFGATCRADDSGGNRTRIRVTTDFRCETGNWEGDEQKPPSNWCPNN